MCFKALRIEECLQSEALTVEEKSKQVQLHYDELMAVEVLRHDCGSVPVALDCLEDFIFGKFAHMYACL